MHIIEAPQVHQLLQQHGYTALVQALHTGFAGDFTMPPRQVLSLAADSHDAFALLPAWNAQLIAVKAFTYFPNNAAQGFASLYSKMLIFGREHGEPLALVDGTSLTLWRTAAVSALAARLLARADASSMLLLGTGKLAEPIVHAHLALRPLTKVMLWGRRGVQDQKAQDLQSRLQAHYPEVEFCIASEVASSAAFADIIVSATASAHPLLAGHWLRPGCHVDLLGNHSPQQRECDSALVMRTSVYADSRVNVLREAGEILLPIHERLCDAAIIRAELAELCRAHRLDAGSARQSQEEITLFKSVGTALADLLTAQFILASLNLL